MKRVVTAGALASATVGLAASLATAIDELGAHATFCAESGCETVRRSSWSHLAGVPMWALGVGFFGAMIALAFGHRVMSRRVLAVAGGAWAVLLIVVQATSIGAWCKLCLVADPAAIATCVFVLLGAERVAVRAGTLAGIGLGLGATVLALAGWTRATAEPPISTGDAPPLILAANAGAPAGTVTIVEFVDFECPYCREMQKRMDEAIATAGVPVRFVRKMFPLPNHRHAAPAAVAYELASAQGCGDAMAHAMFEADPKELSVAGCQAIATRAGCDLERYLRDFDAGKAKVLADIQDAKVIGIEGIPTVYIGDVRLVGPAAVDDLVTILKQQE